MRRLPPETLDVNCHPKMTIVIYFVKRPAMNLLTCRRGERRCHEVMLCERTDSCAIREALSVATSGCGKKTQGGAWAGAERRFSRLG